ncbi:MAG: ABC transporter permease [Sulfolobales archaeon]
MKSWITARAYVFSDPRGVAGVTILASIIMLIPLAPLIVKNNPNAIVAQSYAPPSPELPMGADYFGRDIFSRLIIGTGYTLLISLIAASLIVGIGLFIGSLSGYLGGVVDEVFMRITDIFLLIPAFFIYLIISAYIPPSNTTAAIILGVFSWPTTARIIRSQVISLKASGYVEAARAVGAGTFRIIGRHIIPNMIPLIVISFIQDLVYAVNVITTLIFLGLGDIRQPTWGETLYWAFNTGALYRGAWWAMLYPSLFIILYSIALILINESINKKLRSM